MRARHSIADQHLPTRSSVADIISGAAAGLAAALATNLFQNCWTVLGMPPTTLTPAEPPTEILATEVFRKVTGTSLTGMRKTVAGEAVHLVTGAALGIAYQVLIGRWPTVASGRGAIFGLGVWATVEEGGLAVLGLKPLPWQVEPAEHIFAATSHLVFGLVLARCLEPRQTVASAQK